MGPFAGGIFGGAQCCQVPRLFSAQYIKKVRPILEKVRPVRQKRQFNINLKGQFEIRLSFSLSMKVCQYR